MQFRTVEGFLLCLYLHFFSAYGSSCHERRDCYESHQKGNFTRLLLRGMCKEISQVLSCVDVFEAAVQMFSANVVFLCLCLLMYFSFLM